MRSCERPLKRSASEALPSSVSNLYCLSIRPHGSSCRRRASSSLRRVSSFSALSSSSRAASHSLRVPIMCFVIALLSFLRVSLHRSFPSVPRSVDVLRSRRFTLPFAAHRVLRHGHVACWLGGQEGGSPARPSSPCRQASPASPRRPEPSPRTASPVPPSSLSWMASPYRSARNPPCSVPKRSRGPGSSPQPFDLLGQDAGEVLPALLVAAAHLVVGEPVVRQHEVGGAAGRRHLDGHPGLEPARRFRHPRELQQPRALHAQVAAVVRPQTAGMVRLPIPNLLDRGLSENGPVRLEPAPEQVGFGPRVEDLFGRSFDPAGDRDPEEGGGRARSGSRHRQSLFLFALRNASSVSRRSLQNRS